MLCKLGRNYRGFHSQVGRQILGFHHRRNDLFVGSARQLSLGGRSQGFPAATSTSAGLVLHFGQIRHQRRMEHVTDVE